MRDGHPSVCPECGESYAEGSGKFHQDFTASRVVGWVYGNPTTVGQQMEINARTMGKEKLEMEIRAEQEKRLPINRKGGKRPLKPVEAPEGLPWYRSGEVEGLPKMEKPLDARDFKSDVQVKEYVDHGVLPK